MSRPLPDARLAMRASRRAALIQIKAAAGASPASSRHDPRPAAPQALTPTQPPGRWRLAASSRSGGGSARMLPIAAAARGRRAAAGLQALAARRTSSHARHRRRHRHCRAAAAPSPASPRLLVRPRRCSALPAKWPAVAAGEAIKRRLRDGRCSATCWRGRRSGPPRSSIGALSSGLRRAGRGARRLSRPLPAGDGPGGDPAARLRRRPVPGRLGRRAAVPRHRAADPGVHGAGRLGRRGGEPRNRPARWSA